MVHTSQWWHDPKLRKADRWGVWVNFLERTEWGNRAPYGIPFIRKTLRLLDSHQPYIETWVEEDEMGRRRVTGLDGFDEPVLAFWEAQLPQARPPDVAERLQNRYDDMDGVRDQLRKKQCQSMLPEELQTRGRGPPGPAPAPWDHNVPPREHVEPVDCEIWQRTWDSLQRVAVPGGHIEHRKAHTLFIPLDGDGWQVEKAKAKQWEF